MVRHDRSGTDAVDESERHRRPTDGPTSVEAAGRSTDVTSTTERDDGSAWRDRVDELLLAGERVRERVTVGDHAFVVTSHRVLSFRPPAADGPRFRAVDRPNVVDVRTETYESLRLLGWAIGLAVVGATLATVAVSVDFAGLLPTLDGGRPGVETVQAAIDALSAVLAAFGQFMFLTGLVVVLAGLGTFLRYARGRGERLVIAVSGDANLSAPGPDDPELTVYALERAIEGEPVVRRGGLVGVRTETERERARTDGELAGDVSADSPDRDRHRRR